MVFCAGFTSLLLWVSGNRRDKISTEKDMEIGQDASLSTADASYEDASEDRIKPETDELQNSI